MARFSGDGVRARLDGLFSGGATYWFFLFVLMLPIVRLAEGGMDLYPFQLALGLLLGAQILEEGGWPLAFRALKPLLLLALFMVLMSALRGQWDTAAMMAGLTLFNFLWGAAAYRYGLRNRDASAPMRALTLLPLWMLAMGLVSWFAQAFWPAACEALNCASGVVWPFAFDGGWQRPDTYLTLLIFLLPILGTHAIFIFREGRRTPGGTRLMLMLGVLGLSLVAGIFLWGWALLLLSLGLLGMVLLPEKQRGDGLLLKASAVFALFSAIVVYGMEPGYFDRAMGAQGALPTLRINLQSAPPTEFSSEKPTPLTLELVNAGWRSIGADPLENPEHALWVGTQLTLKTERGLPKVVAGERIPILHPLIPGESLLLMLPVRLPHWAREGFLSLRLENGRGDTLPLTDDSHPGWRVSNEDYRPLESDLENRLSALWTRAQEYHSRAYQPPPPLRERNAFMQVVGAALDTLFFSPLWGEARVEGSKLSPLPEDRPFWPALFSRYGLIGLGLALWFALRLGRTALALAQSGGRKEGAMVWRLLPVAVILWVALGFFSPELASYHAFWAFFILSGFCEGRRALEVPTPHSSTRRRR